MKQLHVDSDKAIDGAVYFRLVAVVKTTLHYQHMTIFLKHFLNNFNNYSCMVQAFLIFTAECGGHFSSESGP